MENLREEHWYWGKELIACFDDLKAELSQHNPPVVDREIIPPLCGSPDGIFAWFICEKAVDLERLKAAQESLKARVQSRMEVRGFPSSAISSLQVNSTSLEEIERGGGRFYFFR